MRDIKTEEFERELKSGSLPHDLLRFIFFASAASRTDIGIVAESDFRQVAGRGMESLLTRGLVHEESDGYFRITPLGRRVLARIDRNEYISRNVQDYPSATVSAMRRNLNQKSVTAQALALFANACVYPCDKPQLFDLARTVNTGLKGTEPAVPADHEYASLPDDLESSLRKNGYYYTVQEIRTAVRQMGKGLEETIKASRLIGIFIRKNALYFVYHSNSQVVAWNNSAEREMVHVLTRELLCSEEYFQMGPICIFTGKSYSIAPTITLGYPYGRMKDEKVLEEQTEEATKDMTPQEKAKYIAKRDDKKNWRLRKDEESGRFSKYFRYSNDLFKEIYCIPLKPAGRTDLYNILRLNRNVIQKAAEFWFSGKYQEKIKDSFRLLAMPEGYRIGRHLKSGLPAVYIPALECKMLRKIKDEEVKVVVVTYGRIADGVSHSLGPAAVRFYDIDSCEPIENVTKYDKYGYPEDDHAAQAARERMEEQQKIKRQSAEKKSPVYIKDSHKEILRELAKENQMSLVDTVSLAMEILLRNHRQELEGRMSEKRKEDEQDASVQ